MAFEPFPGRSGESAPATTTADDGGFRLRLRAPQPELELLARSPDGLPWISPPLPRCSKDLGTFVLPRGRRIRGRVTDSAGVPVACARVLLRSDSGVCSESWTDDLGDFEDLAPPGRFDLLVTAAGFETTRVSDAPDEARVTLRRGGAIRGQVRCARELSLEALEVVAAEAGPWCRAPVAADGSFRLDGLSADGEVALELRPRRTDPGVPRELLRFVDPVRACVDGAPVVLWIPSTGEVRVRLVDRASGAALAAQTPVHVSISATVAGRELSQALPPFFGAHLVLRDVPLERACRVRVEARGYRPELLTLPARRGLTGPSTLTDLALVPLDPLSVLVVDATSGAPVPDAAVSDGRASARADADGRALLSRPAAGGAIVAHHPDFLPARAWPRGDEDEVRIPLERAGRIDLRVVDATGDPVPGARIVVGPASDTEAPATLSAPGLARPGRERTDSSGAASWMGLAPGLLDVRVFVPLYAGGPIPPAWPSARARVRLRAGERRELTLELGPRGDVCFEARTPSGPLVEARLSLLSDAPGEGGRHGDSSPVEIPLGTTDPRGRLALEGLPLGPATLRLVADGARERCIETVLAPGGTVPLVLDAR
ncbi:MAG TPA: carboxypeptidase regulatory-like domain-containing protein [Planctomycetes bacterium]|nr:carboxypeptidase regulatory-like domain-containing protein [Planctomycetota bacterium]